MKHSDIVSLVLHGVALPLVSAVVNGSHGRDEDKAIDDVSELLTRASEAVKQIDEESALSESPLIDLNDRMDLLAACCNILANDYMQNDALPSELDLKRHVSSLNALLATRSSTKTNDQESQSGLRFSYLEGYAPLIKAVNGFSFGQAESKMIQQVSQYIEDAARAITQNVYGDKATPFAQHHIRSALIALYAACHTKEVSRIMALGDHQRDNESNDAQLKMIWTDFELHKQMIAVIAETMRAENIPKRDDIEIEGITLETFQNLLEEPDISFDDPIDFYLDPTNDDAPPDSESDDTEKRGPMTFFKSK